MAPLRLFVAAILVLTLSSPLAWPAKKKKEEPTQVLELPKDPPQAVIADAGRLVFHASPLSAKGLLSQQVRDGLRALLSATRGAQIVKIRAFAAGSGDVRRVQAIVSELYTDRRQPVPAVTVVQVGGLPLVGAQVVLQSVAVSKREVNPSGLAFVSGQPGPAAQAPDRLATALASAGIEPDGMRRVTCYLNSLDNIDAIRVPMAAKFPKAPATYVQLRRDSTGDFASCEGVAAAAKAPEGKFAFAGSADGHSQIALTGPGRLVLTGAQLAFGREEADLRLAFDRAGKALESNGTGWSSTVVLNTFALTSAVAERSAKVRRDVLQEQPAAGTMLVFEGLPSLDALLAMDAVAVLP